MNIVLSCSRDRLSFSKSILRRFIRDCVDRDAAVASPWTVKPLVAKRFGVDSVMPEDTRKGVENIKKGEIDKRKKVWEAKEGPPTKKQKKMTAAQEEKGMFRTLPSRPRYSRCALQRESLLQRRRQQRRKPSGWRLRRRRRNPFGTLRKIWTSLCRRRTRRQA